MAKFKLVYSLFYVCLLGQEIQQVLVEQHGAERARKTTAQLDANEARIDLSDVSMSMSTQHLNLTSVNNVIVVPACND
jgi:hypothetical protein